MTRSALVLRGIVIAVACLIGMVAASFAGGAPAPPAAGGLRGALLPPGVRAPSLAGLRDERSRPVTLPRGRVAVVLFATAVCEDTCALTLQTVRGALDELGRDVPAVAVAVDPAHDTLAAARHFLTDQRVAGRIRFALGPRARLAPVWRGFGVQPQTKAEHHQARIVLVDRRGIQRVGSFAGATTPEELAHDLRVLTRER